MEEAQPPWLYLALVRGSSLVDNLRLALDVDYLLLVQQLVVLK